MKLMTDIMGIFWNCVQVNATEAYSWSTTSEPSKGPVSSGIKPLSESMLKTFYDIIKCQQVNQTLDDILPNIWIIGPFYLLLGIFESDEKCLSLDEFSLLP